MSENNNDWQYERSMSPRQYERTIRQLGLDQAKVGRFLGISERTSRRYISGDTEIPTAVALLLRCCVAHNITPLVPKWRAELN